MSSGCSCIISVFSHKGAGDHSAYSVFSLKHFSCNFTIAIKFFHRHNVLMSSNLEHTVRRSVYNQLSGFYVFIPVIFYHFCSGIRLIAQHAPPCFFGKFFQHFLGEAVGIGRKGIGRVHTGNLPMPDGGILSAGCFLHPCNHRFRFIHAFVPVHAVDIEKSQLLHIRHMKIRTGSCRFDGIGSCICIICGIRHCSDSHTVQHN